MYQESKQLGVLEDEEINHLLNLFRQVFPREAVRLETFFRERCIAGVQAEIKQKAEDWFPWIIMGTGVFLAIMTSRRR